jgi:pimeloyl-ACP methyl ester carboxylesterase
MGRDDLLNRLGGITLPTLVIAGEEDKRFPLWKSQRITKAIPGAELAVIPQAGHLAPVENPGAVTDALVNFLAKL